MIRFNSDYCEGAHERILARLTKTNLEQTPGYGEDEYCKAAAQCIRSLCEAPDAAVHFLVGGTQANLTVVSAALRPYQGVISASSGHINVHETGAIEATGHKVLSQESTDGKLRPQQIETTCRLHFTDEAFEHMPQPKMVYISNPTELGTIYSLQEIKDLRAACDKYGLLLFMDGARLGYGFAAQTNNLTLKDLAQYCDVFYIGGTKVGALFGEAVVITNKDLQKDFRYIIKQKGGMLAKGRLLGLQFLELLEDGLYFELGQHAVKLADTMRKAFTDAGYAFYVNSPTNQIFAIIPDKDLAVLKQNYSYAYQLQLDDANSVVRFCTSWATRPEDVDTFINSLKLLAQNKA
ncbi:MAG: threonine aldolase family protein [Oscillospiraceae bacterium]